MRLLTNKFLNLVGYDAFLLSFCFSSALAYGKIYLMHIFIVYWFVSRVLSSSGTNIPFPKSVYFLTLSMLCSYSLISTYWSRYYSYAIQYNAYIFIGFFVSFFICINLPSWEYLIRSLKTVAWFFYSAVILGIIEILTPLRWPLSPYSNWSSLFGRMSTIDDMPKYSQYLTTIPTSYFFNPNDFSAFIILCLPLAFFIKSLLLRFFLFLSTFFIIFLSGSRSAFLAYSLYVLLLVIYYFCFRPDRYRISSKFFPFILFIIFTFLSLPLFINLPQLFTSIRSFSLDLFETLSAFSTFSRGVGDSSLSIRVSLLKSAFFVFNNSDFSLFFGLGSGMSTVIPSFISNSREPILASLHFFWAELLFNYGLIWFVIFLSFIYSLLRNLFMSTFTFIQPSSFVFYSFFSSGFTFLIASIGSSSLIYFCPLWIFLGLSISALRLNPLSNATH